MRVMIHGGTVVTGDGATVLERGVVFISNGEVDSVESAGAIPGEFDGLSIDASGHLVTPGFINMHTHGVSPAPLFPSAERALGETTWLAHLDRHLLAGTTTVLSLCGFGTMDEIREADSRHAVNVRGATTHTPASLLAAERAGGSGLANNARAMTAEKMVEDGAVAIGELAGGQTLGGGGQDLIYIPNAVYRATGARITQQQSREIKEAVLGRFLDARSTDHERLATLMTKTGLDGLIGPGDLARLIRQTVMASVEPAIEGIREGVRMGRRLGVPSIVHSAAASASVMRELMLEGTGGTVIAAHVNHTSHTPQEAVALAREGREHGWFGEACAFDLVQTREMVPTREHWDDLLAEEGLVSVLATDYGHEGAHDSLFAAVADVVSQGHRSVAQAVAMVTSSVASLIPGISDGPGVLRRGAPADVVVAGFPGSDEVRDVFVGGELVVENGSLTSGARR